MPSQAPVNRPELINHGSAVERELVLRLASVLWRLRRAPGIETALFESVTDDSRKHERRPSRESPGEAADLAERNRLFLGAVQESDTAEGYELSSETKRDIADCFLRVADLPTTRRIMAVHSRHLQYPTFGAGLHKCQ